MKKHTEKPPIDDLFARKLGDASLRPSPDGFARLQARMKPNQPDARLVFWQNPAMQRYMAAAACLLIVAGFGWLYWPSDNGRLSNRTQVATNQTLVQPRSVGSRPAPKPGTESKSETAAPAPEKRLPEPMLANAPAIAQQAPASPVAERNRAKLIQTERLAGHVKSERLTPSVTVPDAAIAKLHKQQLSKTTSGLNEVAQVTNESTTNLPNRPAPVNAADAHVATRNTSPVERVLVVTIAEPEALIAARQAAQPALDDQTTLAATDKPQKETKAGSLWQQVKRVKQGEVFARRDGDNEESGLLSRAYNGLKHSLDKEKSAKQ